MAVSREVVITAAGIVSPIGVGREAFVQALDGRVSGVATITQYDASEFAVQIAAELKDFEPKLYVKPRKSLKVMSREIQMGVASATLAMEEAQFEAELDLDRFGVIYGTPMLYADVPELSDLYHATVVDGKFDLGLFGEQFPKQLLPLWMLKYLPNMTASHIGIAHGARGPNNSIVQGDLSSLLAIIEATTVIQRGAADVMLTGGAGNRLALTGVIYRGDSNLSHRGGAPAQASRPFDADRDGMVIGEGAVTLVLEERSHAERRGATILGSILGYSMTHAGSRRPAGMQHAIEDSIRQCLTKAGLAATDVGQVNAHGSSEIAHDVMESRAIRSALGDVPVTAAKSYFGNIGAASGALELCASLLPNTIPATLNYERADPECRINVIAQARIPETDTILKLNQAATGQAAAVLVRRH